MLTLSPQAKIWVALEPIDFRKGIDGVSACCRLQLAKDPMSGAIFVFCNRARTGLRLLAYDGQGFWLCTKRFSQGKLKWWPATSGGSDGNQNHTTVAARELQILLWNGDPSQAQLARDWRPIVP